MFARLSIYENVDLDLADQVQKWFEATDNDRFADLPGYSGSMTLVDADVAVASPLIASDFELINPLGNVLTRNDVLGGVSSGALDFISDTVTSQIRVRLHGNTAVLRYRHTIDIAVVPIGHLTHPAWTTALYERRKGDWQIVWEQTSAIGPLPLPS